MVITQPSTNQLPAPGSSRLAFLPNQPSPARWATSRSTIALSSANATARSSAARRRRAIARKPGPQRRVVVDPRVPGDARLRAGRPRRLVVGEVRAGADDDRPGARHGARRIGRAIGVVVREAHAGGQPGGLALVEGGAGSLEHGGRRHAEVLDPVLAGDGAQLVEGRHGVGAAHAASVRAGAAPWARGEARSAA